MRSKSVKSIRVIVWSVTETSSALLFPCGFLFPTPPLPPFPPPSSWHWRFLIRLLGAVCQAFVASSLPAKMEASGSGLSQHRLQDSYIYRSRNWGCRTLLLLCTRVCVCVQTVCVEDEVRWSVSHIQTFLPVCTGGKHGKITHWHLIWDSKSKSKSCYRLVDMTECIFRSKLSEWNIALDLFWILLQPGLAEQELSCRNMWVE